MTVLVTGAAGFIGAHLSQVLLARGARAIGLDNLNPYYDVALKHHRLAALQATARFTLLTVDLADADAVSKAVAPYRHDITEIVHLAAQAGVRHSIDQPLDYLNSNLAGHLHVLELARHLPRLRHLVYASSSSVYGIRQAGAFALADAAETPASLYAATKRANELMSASYSHLYGMPQTGLRFFTVYGPAGRPDMAYFKFTEAILAGQPIKVNGDGRQIRDFTYIDDIVAGIVAALDRPPAEDHLHRLFNLGNDRPAALADMIAEIESACGRRAEIVHLPPAAGDVPATWADISASRTALGYQPRITLKEGIRRFVDWYRGYVSADHSLVTERAASQRL